VKHFVMASIMLLAVLSVGLLQAPKAQAANWQSVSISKIGSAGFTMALKDDGTLWSWGNNSAGQLGDGSYDSRRLAPLQIGAGFQSVSVGANHTEAIKGDGTLWAWGWNAFGKLGDGTTHSTRLLVQVGTDADWLSVAAGGGHTVAIKKGGTLWAWGDNTYGNLGDGTNYPYSLKPEQIGANSWQSVVATEKANFAIRSDGTLWSWGDAIPYHGVLTVPVQIGTDSDWQSVSALKSVLAIKKDGTLWAWGDNSAGQLGDGTKISRTSPLQIGTAADWRSVATGFDHTVAIKKDGTLWVWGTGPDMGTGPDSYSLTPHQFGVASNWQSVSVGIFGTLALTNGGALWGWGGNSNGVLGNGTTIPNIVPDPPGYPLATAGNRQATAGNRQATVSFEKVNTYGGNPAVTGYTVTSSPGGISRSGAASPLFVTGLDNGTAYTFSVTATNAAGVGAPSVATRSVVPGAGPLDLSPQSAAFSASAPGAIRSQAITVTNISKATVSIDSSALTGDSAAEFNLDDSCRGTTLASQASCTVTVNFLPASCGDKAALLSLWSGAESYLVPIRGVVCGMGNANLTGKVVSAETLLPIAGARVVMGPLAAPVTETVSGADGGYSFPDVAPGSYPLAVRMDGYDQYGATVILSPLQSQWLDVELEPAGTGVRVVSVKSKYDHGKPYFFLPGEYVGGSAVNVEFTATVDWNGRTPGTVLFKTAHASYEVATTTTTAVKTLNITAEFDPCTTLTVVAVPADGRQSAENTANFLVAKKFSTLMAPTTLQFIDERSKFSYSPHLGAGEGKKQFSLINVGSLVRSGIPLLAGKSLLLTWMPNITFLYDSDEQAKFRADWEDQVKGDKLTKKGLSGFSALKAEFAQYTATHPANTFPKLKSADAPEVSLFPIVDVTSSFNPESCKNNDTGWSLAGHVGMAYDFSRSWEWQGLYVIPTPIPIPVPWYTMVTARAKGDVLINVLGLALNNESMEGSFKIKPSLAGTIGVGLNRVVGIDGTITGEFGIGASYPAGQGSVDFSLDATAKAYVHKFSYGFVLGKGAWCLSGNCAGAPKASALAVPGAAGLIPRDYLSAEAPQAFKRAPRYALKQVASATQSYSVATTPVITSTYPQSEAFLSSAGNRVNLLWLTDNPQRSNVNGTMLMHASFDGSAWSTPVPVADDGTADFNPVSLSFSDGSMVAAWEDVKTVLGDAAPLQEMAAQQEISVAFYNPVTKVWGNALRLTDNGTLDGTPKLAGTANDNILLTWIGNEANDFTGSAATPNKLWFALFNGTSWSTPQVAATLAYPVKRYSVAYDGSTAQVVLAMNSSGDPASLDDLELYRLSYTNGAWGGLIRLTSDSAIDDNPQLSLDPQGSFILTWIKGGELSSVVDFDFTKRTVIRSETGYSSTLADYKQATTGDGKVAIIFAGVSDNSSSDLFVTFFDPVLKVWGQPKQMSFDAETEMRPSLAFLGNETLVAVYNRKAVLNADGTPSGAALTDLYLLTHTMGNDLALEEGSLTVDPETAAPGEEVTLSVNALNMGDQAGRDIPVTFYNGDPAAGGIALGSVTIGGIFKPGDSETVTLPWTIPAGSAPVKVYAVIDPSGVTDSVNRANNMTSIVLGMPDLELSGIEWQRRSNTQISVTVTVTNNGGTSSGATTLKLRSDSAGGALIASLPVKALARFESIGLNYLWEVSALQQPYTLFAVVNEGDDFIEANKLNNSATEVISATPPGAPTGVSALAGDAQVTVSFLPPVSDGGSPITSYDVTASPDGLTATGSSSPILLPHLTNSTAYTFSVAAHNGVGAGRAATAASLNRLGVTIDGSGSGSVNSIPSGLSCTGGTCAGNFSLAPQPSLTPLESNGSQFSGWGGGACTGTGICQVDMRPLYQNLTATFTSLPNVLVKGNPQFYGLIHSAYDNCASSAVIQAQGITFMENLSLGTSKAVSIKGGFDPGFSTQSGYTVLQGILTVSKGRLVVDHFAIR
jgi:alpha-tubulin suppressor-like RCC1 family protein